MQCVFVRHPFALSPLLCLSVCCRRKESVFIKKITERVLHSATAHTHTHICRGSTIACCRKAAQRVYANGVHGLLIKALPALDRSRRSDRLTRIPNELLCSAGSSVVRRECPRKDALRVEISETRTNQRVVWHWTSALLNSFSEPLTSTQPLAQKHVFSPSLVVRIHEHALERDSTSVCYQYRSSSTGSMSTGAQSIRKRSLDVVSKRARMAKSHH